MFEDKAVNERVDQELKVFMREIKQARESKPGIFTWEKASSWSIVAQEQLRYEAGDVWVTYSSALTL